MRTSIILDDALGRRLQEQGRREGKSFGAFLAEAGRRALDLRESPPTRGFRLVTLRGSGPAAGIDPDRTADLMEGEYVGAFGGGRIGRPMALRQASAERGGS